MATQAIGALQESTLDIGALQAGVAAAVTGQVIFITKADRETAIKAVFPVMWACQGNNDRRNFLKYTGLAVIGL